MAPGRDHRGRRPVNVQLSPAGQSIHRDGYRWIKIGPDSDQNYHPAGRN
jgi:hypothetical protein